MTAQTGLMAYITAFIFTFFAASFMVARYTDESPTEPKIFLLLTGLSLVWPLTLPSAVVGFLLLGIAHLADELACR